MAWTITETPSQWFTQTTQGDRMIKIKLACTSDAGASDYDVTNIARLRGSLLYLVKIVPGTGGDAPAGAFDLDIEDENNHHILDTDANPAAPTGGATYHAGSNTMGVYPPIEDSASAKVSLVCATLGDGNKADIYLYFVK